MVPNTGGTRSPIHVTVLDVVAELPHPSLTTNVRVCDCKQPLVATVPSEGVINGVPQADVAVALPSAVLISAGDGLHPNVTLS